MQRGRFLWLPVAIALWAWLLVIAVAGVVHALGHWLAARALGLDVRFSLGTGSTLASWSDGRFRLSALPGAYVSPIEPLRFGWASVAFLAAGPLANLAAVWLLPFALFVGVSVVEGGQADAVVRFVDPLGEGQAWARGDRIRAVAGQPVRGWTDARRAIGGPGAPVTVEVERDGRVVDIVVEHFSFVYPSEPRALLGVDDPSRPLGRSGLRTGDVVTGVDGRVVETEAELTSALANADDVVVLTVERFADPVTVRREAGESWGFHPARRFVRWVIGGAGERAGVQPGDMIVALDFDPVLSWSELEVTLREYGGTRLELSRGGSPVVVTLDLPDDDSFRRSGIVGYPPDREITERPVRPTVAEGLSWATASTNELLGGTLRILGQLATGRAPATTPVVPSTLYPVGPGRLELGARALGVLLVGGNLWLFLYNLMLFPWSDGLRFVELASEAALGRRVQLAVLGWVLISVVFGIIFVSDVMRLLGG